MTRVAGTAKTFALALLVGALIGTMGTASGHSASTYYLSGDKWAGDSMGFYWDPSITSTSVKDAITDPIDNWNGQAADFSILRWGDNVEIEGEWDDCSKFAVGQNYVSKEPMPSYDYAAFVVFCNSPDSFTKQMRFNDDPDDVNWYVNLSTTLDSGETDMRSMASHEWGHWTGWSGHFSESGDYCPSGSLRHTMCPSVIQGTTMMRTLETHDEHTFNAAYP